MKTPKWIEYGSRFWISGTQYFDIQKVRGHVSLGKQVRFVGNPSNIYDVFAIRVMFEDVQIGWVPKDSAIQHGIWSEHGAKSKIIGVITGLNLTTGSNCFEIQTLVLRAATKTKLPKQEADVLFSSMKEELSYMVK
jgi:hypothetical protein